MSEKSIPQSASDARQTGKNEPLEPRDLAAACSGGKEDIFKEV